MFGMTNLIIGFLLGFLLAWQLVKRRLWITFINEVLEDINEKRDTLVDNPSPENQEDSRQPREEE